MTDPIIEELHQIREQLAAQFNYDIRAIVADLQAREKTEDRLIVSFAEDRPTESKPTPILVERLAA